MEEVMVADVLRDAIAAADDHLKIAREKLFEAHNVLQLLKPTDGRLLIATVTKETITIPISDDKTQEQPFFQETQASGLAVAWTVLALLVTLITIVGFLRKRNFNVTGGGFISEYLHKMESCFRSAYAKLGEICCRYQYKIDKETLMTKLQQLLILIKLQKINKKYVKNEIRDSIENFRSAQEQLKLMKSQKVDTMDVKDIKAAIKTVLSIQDHLKVMKSQEINEEQVKEIEAAIQPAIKAIESMEKIINKGDWLPSKYSFLEYFNYFK